MNSLIGRTPFLRLLIPVIIGIVASAFLPFESAYWLPISLTGLAAMLLSLFVQKEKRYKARWLFGAGFSLFLCAFASLLYQEAEKDAAYDFPESEAYFIGTILDIPEVKPRSMACHIETTYPIKKRVLLYLELSNEARQLAPGDELVFRARMRPFQNMGNPDDFDYVRFMQIKGFSGTSYVPGSAWSKTGRERINITILSQRCRARLLNFYRSFRLDKDAFAFISAITLGYKAYLSDDLQEAFRASGTAHVLAVSGLHVGIIYMVIGFLFSFLGKQGVRYKIRQLLVVVSLWAYALIAGLSAPIFRATFMLTIYCVGQARNRAGFSYNTLAASAFFLLLINPFSLFDLSFQMSFMAVFAILFIQPKMQRIYTPNNRVSHYLWNLSTVSLSAQLGVFPLVMYHFGSFPTYFFIANLLVVPLLSLVIYASIPLIAVSLFPMNHFPLFTAIESAFRWILGTLVEIIFSVVNITETLPYAQLTNKHITFFQFVFLLIAIYFFIQFLHTRLSRPLLVALVATQLFLMSALHSRLTTVPPRLVVYNNPSSCDIGFYANNRRHFMELPASGMLPHPEKSILLLSDQIPDHLYVSEPIPLDVLILSQHNNFNIDQLLTLFSPKEVVLDSSLPWYAANRLKEECSIREVPLHDVSLQGAYSIYF